MPSQGFFAVSARTLGARPHLGGGEGHSQIGLRSRGCLSVLLLLRTILWQRKRKSVSGCGPRHLGKRDCVAASFLASEVVGFVRVAFLALKNTLAVLRRSRPLATCHCQLPVRACVAKCHCLPIALRASVSRAWTGEESHCDHPPIQA